MCAIIDANVAHEVFGPNPSEAGSKFFDWLQSGKGKLISSGKNLRELEKSGDGYRKWASVAIKRGRLKKAPDMQKLETREKALASSKDLISNDAHIIALAQLSGARLLYSNDEDLQKDFDKKTLIDRPRGKVYSTIERKDFRDSHRKLLATKNLCRSG